MMTTRTAGGRWVRRLAAVTAAALLVTACGSSSDTSSEAEDDPAGATDTAEEAGATTEPDDSSDEDVDYAAALADMPETVLQVQSLFGPENVVSTSFDEWGRVLEERSGGKISFEMYYAGSLVPLPELEEGMASGLIDMAVHIPVYSPDSFPVSTLISDLAFLGEQSPVIGTLQGLGANIEMGFSEAHREEMQEAGLQPLIPLHQTVVNFHLLCRDDAVTSLDEASGKRVRVSSPGFAAEAEALGMVPVQLVGAEVFEGFERGIVDCAIGSVLQQTDEGLPELASHWTIDPVEPFSGFSSTHLSMSKDTWDSLPAPAQQLIWETSAEVFLSSFLATQFSGQTQAISDGMEQYGIEVHEWEDDARQALMDHHDQVLDDAASRADELVGDGQAFVDEFVGLHDEWLSIVEEDLGYSDQGRESWLEFAQNYEEVDIQPFIDRLIKDVIAPRIDA